MCLHVRRPCEEQNRNRKERRGGGVEHRESSRKFRS